jgi:hypothetical protein
MNSAVPGGAVQVYLKANKKNQPYEFDGKVIKFVAF